VRRLGRPQARQVAGEAAERRALPVGERVRAGPLECDELAALALGLGERLLPCPLERAGDEAAAALAVSTATIRRWLKNGLLPGEQVSAHAPWRIRLTDELRKRFLPEVPEGFVPLAEAATLLGVARQTVLHQVQRGERRAIQVTQGRRKGLRIEVSPQEAGLFATD